MLDDSSDAGNLFVCGELNRLSTQEKEFSHAWMSLWVLSDSHHSVDGESMEKIWCRDPLQVVCYSHKKSTV